MDELRSLIFRTDRLGDFIISCPFIISYKKKFPETNISIVSSEYNSNYINNFSFIDDVVPLKMKINFLRKLYYLFQMILILRKKKYKNIIVLDGKKRSFFISLFLKGDKSILLQSKGLVLFSKIFNYKRVINYEIQNQIKNFSYLANLLNFNIDLDNIKLYKNYNFKRKFDFQKKYIIIHLDEKWYKELYYTDFTDINPTSEQINSFVKKILHTTDNNFEVVITSGSKKIAHLETFLSDFNKPVNNIYTKQVNNVCVRFIKNTTFNDLESLVKYSSFLVCCEGGISHVSNNFNIPTFALYEKNRLQHTKFWTGHMTKLTLVERKNMHDLLNDNQFYDLLKTKIKNS